MTPRIYGRQKSLPTVFLTILLLVVACRKPIAEIKQNPITLPAYFPEVIYKPTQYQTTTQGIALGRLLFYDPILSADSTISCASCHQQEAAFADKGKALSLGVNKKVGLRNSPALFNLQWHPHFMWDGGINHLEIMPLAPITDTLEMNADWNVLLTKLNENKAYKNTFKAVYGNDKITDQLVYFSLAQFMASMVSADSKYDKYLKDQSVFNHSEINGLAIFNKHCNSCHTAPLFTNFKFANNGLYLNYKNIGRYRITQDPKDIALFKTPSLRNCELSNPYMHNGSMQTLAEVIEHYSNNIQAHSNLTIPLQGPLHLTSTQKAELLAFLHTLTDSEFINKSQFRNPLK